jgi:hypothetical protein
MAATRLLSIRKRFWGSEPYSLVDEGTLDSLTWLISEAVCACMPAAHYCWKLQPSKFCVLA